MAGGYYVCVLVLVLLPACASQGDELEYSVYEEQPRGTEVGDVARDSNISTAIAGEDLAAIRYRILQGSATGAYFSIGNRSGKLVTASVLDRENITICEFKRVCMFSIYVSLQSGQFFRTILVNIKLKDINDQVPKFPHRSILLEISESVSIGTGYTIDSAEDLDGGENNSVQSYELIPKNDTFALRVSQNVAGEDVLTLVVTSPLNREVKDFYQRIVRARDGGNIPNIGELIVNISITDVNDNSPVFTQTEYSVNVSEALPQHTPIFRVHASDRDSGLNGRVYYRLSPQQSAKNREIFRIDIESGEIILRTSLTSMQGKTIRLVIQAYDGGTDTRITPTFVNIYVMDTINDPPRIELSVINGITSANVLEHSSVGYAVAHLVIVDEDSGRNGEVNCSVISDKFQLQKLKVNQYKVVVSAHLNREERPVYNVSVGCQDSGVPPLNSTASFMVTLLDINDNPPVFLKKNYLVNISENNVIGETIVRVSARDLDAGDNGRITYMITSSYPRITDFINIDPSSGLVTAVDKLDREVIDTLNITVIAFDHGSPPKSANASLTIKILDENDNEPRFREAVYLFKLLENEPIDTIIGRVAASDPDLNAGGFVTYAISTNGQYVPFILTGTGVLSSNDVFDREKKDEYSFDVVARDHGYPSLSNRVRVIVEITDVNDNYPVVLFPNYINMTTKVPFQSPPGTQVYEVRGKDNDTGLNAHLEYYMRHERGNKPYLFSIDKVSGIIFVNKHLREEEVGSYIVYVSCRDQGNKPKLSREEPLEIVVYVGNSTAVFSGVTAGQNALIVITLLCLTVIIAAIVLTVLLRIRRRDRQKKTDSDVNLDELPHPSPPHYPRREEEVEFSSYKPVQVEEEEGKGGSRDSTLPRSDNKHEMLLFKMQLAEQYKQREEETLQKLDSPQKAHCIQETSSNDKYDVTDQQMTRLAALKYQQALIRGSKKANGAQQGSRYGPKGETITDDILSNSSGETTGTDSGRGFSEEDSHSQGRSSLPSETDDSGMPVLRFDCVRDQKRTTIIPPVSRAQQRHPTSSLRKNDTSLMPPSLKSDFSPRSIDSVKLRNSGPKKKPYSVHFDQDSFQTHVPRQFQTFSSPQQPKSNRNNTPDFTFKRGVPGYSVDVLNDSVDDDNTTTTSGSYTIDHEENPEEMITFSGFGLKDVYV